MVVRASLKLSSVFGVLFGAFMMTSCGGGGGDGGSDESQTVSPEFQDVTVGVSQEGFGLAAAASNYAVTVENCATGYQSSVTQAQSTVKVYKADTGCVGKLTSFTVASVDYLPSNPGATPFSSWAVGQTAVFTDSSGTKKMRVTVSSQLTTPIATNDSISYTFSIVIASSGSTVGSEVVGQVSGVGVAGDYAPNFTLDQTAFQGVNAGGPLNGAGKFIFTMECKSSQTGGGSPSCEGLPVTDISYILAKDVYSGAPTLSQLLALTGFTAVTGGQVVTGTSNGRGGFQTTILTGPGPMATAGNEKLLLVLKNGASYQYFPVTVSAP